MLSSPDATAENPSAMLKSDAPASAETIEATDAPAAITAVHTMFLGICNPLIWTRASH